MKRAARVLYVVNDAGFFLSHRASLAAAARDSGYEVHVATPLGPRNQHIAALGFFYHSIPMARSGMHPMQELRTLLALIRLYRRLAPDLVHHVTVKPVLYGGMAAQWTGVRAVVSAITGVGHVFSGSDKQLFFVRKLVVAGYRRVFRHRNTAVVFQNAGDYKNFVDARVVSSDAAVVIKGSGVNISEFRPTPEPSNVSPLIVCPSRMLTSKGVNEFVAAAGLLRQSGVRAKFVLVGDSDPGNPASIPRTTLNDWVSTGAVEWWGHRDDMTNVLANANVVCLPSYSEGVPKSLIEAAACARAIVTTDISGCREIVRHEGNGLLVPPRDVPALAAALERLIRDPALRARMGARGREIAVAEFSLDRVIRETLDVYARLLQ